MLQTTHVHIHQGELCSGDLLPQLPAMIGPCCLETQVAPQQALTCAVAALLRHCPVTRTPTAVH